MIVMMLMVTVSNVCMASDDLDLKGIAEGLKDKGTNDQTNGLQTAGGTIIKFLQTAGVVVAVIILVVVGVKYIMGSAEEKAEYKKVMIPYLVGAVLIAAAPFIAGAVFSFASNVGNATN